METETEEKQVPANEPAEVTNAETVAPTEDVEALKAELQRAKEEAQKHADEAKRQQKAAIEQSKLRKQWEDRITTIDRKIDTSNETIADFLDEFVKRQNTDVYEEKPKEVPSYKARLKALQGEPVDPKRIEIETHVKEVANDIITALQPLGIEFDKSKDFREEYLLFKTGDYDLALEGVKEKASKMMEAKKPVSDIERELAELRARLEKYEKKETLKEKGELVSEKGQPAGSAKVYTIDGIVALPSEEYWKEKPEIDKARREGKIKE